MAGVGDAELQLLRTADGWVLQPPDPAPFRLEPEMVVSSGLGACIGIHRPEEFEQLSNAMISPESPFGKRKDARALRRRLHGGSFDVELDRAGRLPIPTPLIERAGLDQNSGGPLTVIALPEHVHWASCDHWALWAKERRWEALELMHKNSRRVSDSVLTAVGGLYLELAEELRRDPVGVYQLKPRVFEELCAELMAHQGFEVELTPETRDGGIDLYAVRHTAFGRLLLAVDCKRYLPSRPVGVGVVRGMLGAIDIARASAGLLISTSRFSAPARTLAEEHPFRIALQDYFDLQRLLAEYTEGNNIS
jgi:DNA-binding transcriptional regulator/RsmH inhibitor MraZ